MSPELIVHISAGSVALVAGGAALIAAKGERAHRTFGTLFFAAMIVMALLGAYIAAFMPQRGTVIIGMITFYLVATAWMTVRRKESTIGLFEYGALGVAIILTAVMIGFGIWAQNNPKGLLDALPAGVHYAFAAIAALAAVGDLNVIRHGGIAGRKRIARHLWRMCTALLIAALSFFLGQQKVMPEWMRGSPLLFAPLIAVLALMIFWAIKVRFTRWWRENPDGTSEPAVHHAQAPRE
jgi:hypothetical protein